MLTVPDRNQRRLNAFQRAMLEWDSLHPYNAVHVVRVPGVPDRGRLERAISGTLAARGLERLTLSPDRRAYGFEGGEGRCEIRMLDGAAGMQASLAGEIQRQLNTPFVLTKPFCPFRFFVAPGENSFWLGLAYLHAVADAESIVLLLKEIVENYAAGPGQGQRPNAGSHFHVQLGLHAIHPGVVLRKLVELPSLIGNMRRSCRPPCRDASDLNIGFEFSHLDPVGLSRLVEVGRSWGVTVNDVLLALLMKSCAMLSSGRRTSGRRKKISVGCIVNARKDFGGDAQGAFGLFLGSFLVTHAVPEEVRLRELAKDVGQLTSEVKRKRLYLAMPMELAFGRFMRSFFSTERGQKLYQKHYPLWGGLTNMKVNSLWPAQERDEPVDYIRAVSTGPVTPLVLSFTTAGHGANIGLSYRTTVYSSSDVKRLMECFLGSLANLEAV